MRLPHFDYAPCPFCDHEQGRARSPGMPWELRGHNCPVRRPWATEEDRILRDTGGGYWPVVVALAAGGHPMRSQASIAQRRKTLGMKIR